MNVASGLSEPLTRQLLTAAGPGFSSPATPTPRRDVADLLLTRPLAGAR
jgi:hypothetical protein